MSKTSNKRGLALGLVVALLSSVFAFAPANAANTDDGGAIAIRPVAGTTMTGLLSEDFPIYAQVLEGLTTSNFATDKIYWEVTKTAGNVDLMVAPETESPSVVQIDSNADPSSASITSYVSDADDSDSAGDTIDVSSGGADATSVKMSGKVSTNGLAYLYLRAYSASGIVSTSDTVTATVKVWVDMNGGSSNGVHDAGEWFTTTTVTLKGTGNLAPTVTYASPTNGATVVNVSATPDVNAANLDGVFFIGAESTATSYVSGTSFDAVGKDVAGAYFATNSNTVTESFTVAALTESTTISMNLFYAASSPSTLSDGTLMGATGSNAVSTGTNGIDTLTGMVVTDSNAVGSDQVHTVRANQTYNFKFGATSNSTSVSGKALTITVTSSAALTAGVSSITFNGGAATTSMPSVANPVTITTDDDGYATLTVATSGLGDAHSFWVKATSGAISEIVKITTADVNYSLAGDYATYLTTPGTAVNLGYTVEDQWGVANPSTDQLRVMVTRGGDASFSYATTISYHAVEAGVATVPFTPSPATVTGSAQASVALYKYNASLNQWVATSDTATTTINVSGLTDGFDSALASSYSVSVSYWPSTVSYVAVSGTVDNTGSAVVVSAPGLIFKNAAGVTSSDTLTVRGDASRAYSFEVSGMLSGTYTMTLTNGTATTTSLIIVDPAAYTSGATVEFDTTAITAGTTKIITGTVKDANGNGVYTAGTASIAVVYSGTAGIPVGSMPTQTDADGTFRVSVLTAAADSGLFTLTATYLKNGASTALADRITKAQTITVGKATATAGADQKVNAGSFKGYVAVYAKGYAGQRMSAKIGNDWVVVESLASNFERVVDFTGAGYTIAVRIYIDRVLVDTITVTTK
jgi:hypothetical protein